MPSKTPLRVKLTRRAWAAGDAKRDAGLVEPENIISVKDIRYGKYLPYNLLDVYRIDTTKKMPVIVNIHGGGYFYGSKDLYRFYCMELAQAGFSIVNFNYRLSPEFRFPKAIEDINDVFCWIEQHSDEYKFDLDNLFLIGDSAGAQLASHYATINTNKEFAKLFNLKEHSIKIKAVSLACGMYDTIKRIVEDSKNVVMKDYLGKNFDKNDERMNVLKYVTKDFPPAFVFTFENDFLRNEAEPMYNFLKEKGVKTEMYIFGDKADKSMGHVYHENIRMPEAKKANKMQTDFLKSV